MVIPGTSQDFGLEVRIGNFLVSHGFRSFPSSNTFSSMGGTGYGNILRPSPSVKPLRLPCGFRVCPALNGSPAGGFITLV